MDGKMIGLRLPAVFASVLCLFSFSEVTAQDDLVPVAPAVFSNDAPVAPSADDGNNPAFSTRATAIECALSQIAESAGQTHKALSNAALSAFKAGECAGKIQTYMLATQSLNPQCFPKISLEEGIAIFVKWADAHPDQLSVNYIIGFKQAFEEAVPCLKK